MKAAFDQLITTAVKRQHEPQRVIGDFVAAEIAEKQARSIKYQVAVAKLPLAKDIDDFSFAGTPINEVLVRDLAAGHFLQQQRNLVLVSGVAELVQLSRATLANVKQNVAVAVGLKLIFVVTTVTGTTGLWVAILADTGATVLVTLNALWLLAWKPRR